MTATTSETTADQGLVAVDGETVTLTCIDATDSVLSDLLRRCAPEDRPGLVERILVVGARGLATMGIGIDIGEVDMRVHRTVERVTEEASLRCQAMLDEAHRVLTSSLDPDQRSSMIARAVADFGAWRDSFLAQVDPDAAHSHTGKLLAHLNTLLGPGGPLEQRLTAALDPTADGSGLARVSELIERRFGELRDMVAEDRGRKQEATKGTAKGFEYEDKLEELLRVIARPLGVIVGRTSRDTGALGGEAIIGDFVMEWPDGRRLVVEAKNARTLSLTGKDGILDQLDRAMDNRDAEIALCVSAQDSFPSEVGLFGVYGNRILAVDDGDGTMLSVAIRWAGAVMSATKGEHFEVDITAIDDRLQRIKMMAQRFSSNRRALTDIGGSVEKVRNSLDEMRRDLLDLVDEASSEIRRTGSAQVVELSRQVG